MISPLLKSALLKCFFFQSLFPLLSIYFSLLVAAATAGRESIITVRSDERRQLSPSAWTAVPAPNDELFSPAVTDNREAHLLGCFFSLPLLLLLVYFKADRWLHVPPLLSFLLN